MHTAKKSKKIRSFSIVLLLILSSFFIVSPVVVADDWQYSIEENKVYVDNAHVYLSASPHTISSSGWVEFEVMLKQTSIAIDLAWGFDTTVCKATRPQLWRNYSHTITDYHMEEVYGSKTIQNVISYDNLGIENFDSYSVDYGNKNNAYLFRVHFTGDNGQESLIFAFSEYEQDGSTYTLSGYADVWKKYTYEKTFFDWWDVPSENFEIVNYDFMGMNKWYLVLNKIVTQGEMNRVRCYVSLPFGGFEGIEGKYFWACKPHDRSIAEAIATNTFYYIDPWFSSSWRYRRPLWTNSSMITGDVDNFPFLLHIENDTAWSNKCQMLGQDIVFTDENGSLLPYEIEYFDYTNGELIAWIKGNLSSSEDTLFYMYYGNPNATRQENVFGTWDEHFSGVWHMSEQVDEWEFDSSFSFEPDIMHVDGDIFALVYAQSSSRYGYVKTFELIKGAFTPIDTSIFCTDSISNPDIIAVGGDYFAVAYTGSGGDGYVETMKITVDGNITVDSDILEFDTADCLNPFLFHINNSYYGVAYSGSGSDGFLKTFSISDVDGSISNTVTDTYEFDPSYGDHCYVLKLNETNNYAIAYSGTGNDGYLLTVEIFDNGTINKTAIDTYEFDPIDGQYPQLLHIYDIIYSIVYTGPNSDGFVITINISSDGEIGSSLIDSFEYDPYEGSRPSFSHSYQSIYVVAYEESPEGAVVTLQILNDGEITKTVVDEYIFDANKGDTPFLFRVPYQTYPPIQFITGYTGESTHGFLKTFGVTGEGHIYSLYSDSTGNLNYGIGGNGVFSQMPSGTDGIVYRSQAFDGVDDFIFIDDSDTMRMGNKGSVSLWFKLDNPHDNTDTAKRLIGKNNVLGTNGEYLIELNSDGRLRARLFDGLYHTVQTTKASWSAGVWYYVTLVWDTSSTGYGMRLYYNTTLGGSNTDKNYAPNDAGDVRIGQFRDADMDSYEGAIDEVRIADCACTLAWIETSYNTSWYQGVGDGYFIYMGMEEDWYEYLLPPDNFDATPFSTIRIDLTWDRAERADYTYIRYDTATYPATRSEGNLSVNSTGEYFQQLGLTANTTYYFSAWSYNMTNGTWSVNYSYAYATTLSENITVNPPINFQANPVNLSAILLTWTKPSNADYTYIRYATASCPTTRSGGNFSANITGSSFTQSGLLPNTTYYFSAWSYNVTYDYWSINYSCANATTVTTLFYFSSESPFNGETNVSPFPTLEITVSTAFSGTFDLAWYAGLASGTPQPVHTDTGLSNGTYSYNLSLTNDSLFGYYGVKYQWYVVATRTSTSDSQSSDTYYYWTEDYEIVEIEEIAMNVWMILLWIVIWTILLAVNVKTGSTIFGSFAGVWIFLFGLFIIASGIQVETGTLSVAITPSQTVNYIQYSDAVLPYSTYSYVWGIIFFIIGVFIVFSNVVARRIRG